MNRKFLDETVVRKGCLFSYDELSNILSSANKSRVEISNDLGHKMYGRIYNDDNIITAIKRLQDSAFENSLRDPSFEGCFWRTQNINIPKTSILKKTKNVDYYLLINSDGDICVKAAQEIGENDYLVAEMITAYDFIFNNCKINIV
uniref:Uncharacterized protein n=1 Tax=Panagrolaimus sp. PS1159 TaxID=55785 RepID=A0AC35GFH7_9BILA